jgi:hypothetical protein
MIVREPLRKSRPGADFDGRGYSRTVAVEHRSVTILDWIALRTGTRLLNIAIGFAGEGSLAIVSQISRASEAAVAFAGLHGLSFAVLPAFLALALPMCAWGDIYKWTDEKGGINYSDSPPPKSAKTTNVEVVERESKPTPTEQALLARVQNLERQLQAPLNRAPAVAVEPPMPYGDYAPSMPPPPNYYEPPPSNYYDSGYGTGYDSSYAGSYPGYVPAYAYPAVPVYSYVVFPGRTHLARPAFVAPRGGFVHAGGGHNANGGHSARR